MEESLSPEHSGELFRNPLKDLLDGGGVAHEGGGHLETSGRNVTDAGHHVVGDPLNEVAAVLVLDVQHLFVNLLHGHAASEAGGHSEVPAVSGVAGCHHVLGIKHLLGELGDGDSSVLHGASGGERSEPRHEEVETGEGDHVDRQLPEVSIELAWEPEGCGNSGHG